MRTARKMFWLFLLLAAPGLAFAQGVRVDNPGGPATRNVQNFLAPIPGATITVCTSAGTGTPCTPVVPTSPVTLCTDSSCTVAAANPFLADANGNSGAWALPGTYKVSITAPGTTGYLLTVTLPPTPSANTTYTGSNTFTGGVAFGTGSAAVSNWTYFNGNVGGINPTGSTDGLALGWNYSSGGADSDFFAVRSGAQTGGYRFYDWNGTTATLLATMLPTTPLGNLVGDTATQTLTNKTLTSPTSTGTDNGSETLANKTLTSPTSTGTDNGTETLTNKTLTRIQAGTTAPTCSVTGAGTGATCSLASSSNDNSGNMQINTGTSPGTSGTWTLTFNAGWANAGFCSVSLGSGNTTLNARATVFNNSNGSFASQTGNWDNNGVAPTASQATAFLINYVCIGH